jgi:hypothetical protein
LKYLINHNQAAFVYRNLDKFVLPAWYKYWQWEDLVM